MSASGFLANSGTRNQMQAVYLRNDPNNVGRGMESRWGRGWLSWKLHIKPGLPRNQSLIEPPGVIEEQAPQSYHNLGRGGGSWGIYPSTFTCCWQVCCRALGIGSLYSEPPRFGQRGPLTIQVSASSGSWKASLCMAMARLGYVRKSLTAAAVGVLFCGSRIPLFLGNDSKTISDY